MSYCGTPTINLPPYQYCLVGGRGDHDHTLVVSGNIDPATVFFPRAHAEYLY